MYTSANRLGRWVRTLLLTAVAGVVGFAMRSFNIWPATYLPGRWAWPLLLLTTIAIVLGIRVNRAPTPWKRAGLTVMMLTSVYFCAGILLAMTGSDAVLTRSPSAEAVVWEQREAYRLTNLDRYNRDELEFLRPLLEDRRVVLLGESNHCVEQYSQIKSNIIRFLHEELGFNVIAFESYMLSCEIANQALEKGVSPEAAIKCLYPMWNTTTVRRLFRYIASTKKTGTPMELAGFDLKLRWSSWPEAMTVLSAAIESDTSLVRDYRNAQIRFGPDIYERIRRGEIQGDSPLGREFAAFHANLAEEIERLYSENEDKTKSGQRDLLFGAQLARSIAALPNYRAARLPLKRVALRDSAMAENLLYLIDRRYPGEKVIVWAHDEHISRSWSDARLSGVESQAFAWATNRLDRVKRMGEYLSDRYGAAEYAIGLYMASGSYKTIEGYNRRVRPPRHDSVEYLLQDPQAAAVFLDLTGAANGPGHKWMHTPSSVQSESNWYSIVPADQFDGLIVVTRATPPDG